MMIGGSVMVNDEGAGRPPKAVEQTKPAAALTSPTPKTIKETKKKAESSEKKETKEAKSAEAVGQYIRRPLQGMTPKKDTYATLTITNPYGSESTKSPLVNSSTPSGKSSYTANFLIQSISESRQEKAQPVPTFGDTFYYFFGQQPVQIQVSAVLLNSENFEWELEWWHNYSSSLRGTRLVDYNRRVALKYESTKITGFITTCSVQKSANTPMESSLSFTMFVDRKMYSTALGKEPGNNSFTLDKSFMPEMALSNYTEKLNTKVLADTIDFLKNTPDIDTLAHSEAILRDSTASAIVAAGIGYAKTGYAIATNPINSAVDYLLKKENEVTVLASAAFDLDMAGDLSYAAALKLPPLGSSYKYSDILGEYVQRPGKEVNNHDEFYAQVLENIQYSRSLAMEEINGELGKIGFSLSGEVQQDTKHIPEGGLAGEYSREIERRKKVIGANMLRGLQFTANVGVLMGRRAAYRNLAGTAGKPSETQWTSSSVSSILNANSEV